MKGQGSFRTFIDHLVSRYQLGLPGKYGQQPLRPYVPGIRDFSPPVTDNVRNGAVLALLYPVAEEPHIALIRRPEYGGVHSGQIAFPGGKVEPADPDVLTAALRETREEVGVHPDQVKVIGPMTEVFVFASNFMVYPFLAYLDHRPEFDIDPREVEELLEVPFSHFSKEGVVMERTIQSATGLQLRAPYFDLDGGMLWGATAMMVSEILCLKQGAQSS